MMLMLMLVPTESLSVPRTICHTIPVGDLVWVCICVYCGGGLSADKSYHGDGIEPDEPVLDLLGVGRHDLLFCIEAGDSMLLVLLERKCTHQMKEIYIPIKV